MMPYRRAWTPLLVLSFVAALGNSVLQKPPVNPDAQLLQDFQHRIEEYMKLHKKLERESPPLEETSSPEKIKASQDAMAEKLRTARAGAKQGEIFTPAIARHFRKLMQPEVTGPDAPETKKAIKEDAPAAIPLKVNARYPEDKPLPTVPPNLLARLPKLPEDLEYRIVGKDLILRDTHANLIVDFIPRAIP